MNGRKTTVTEVLYGRGWFWVGIVVLTCLSLFCSDARAKYEIDNSGGSNVYGIYDSSTTVSVIGGNFNDFGYVKATANNNNACGIYHDNLGPLASLYIIGEFPSGGIISGTAGTNNAYGLYSWGSIWAYDNINGTITATAYGSHAYALGSWRSMEIDGDIGSDANIAATCWGDKAYGLFSRIGSIKTGDIDGKITAWAGGGNNAYGIYASDNLTTGAINGNITATAGGNNAYGLQSENSSITTGNITGTIDANAGGYYAAGLYSDVNLTTRAITGTISAEAGNDEAYGLYANGSLTTGDINGTITATAGGDHAYGLYSFWGTLTTGAINGTIDANAGGDYARGLFGWESITTGAINGNITATAGGNEAAGLYSANGSIDTNDINGNITATAAGDWAYGLRTHDGSITTGAINGNIIATAGGDIARGLGAWGDITTGAINGTITADANGSNAAALYSWSAVTIDGNIGSSANISAKTRIGSYAYGLYAGSDGSDLTINGDIDGTISADANNSYAYALYAYDDIHIDGNIGSSAHISATATTGSDAYGLYSYNGTIYTGDINGTITATAGGNNAAGLYSYYGSIYTGAINGTITADANNYAYGLCANGQLDVAGIGNDAEITATAGQNNAYGLYSESGSIHIDGDMNGVITATATTGSNAYGLYSNSGTINTGDINGKIIAKATNGSNAYGMRSYDTIDTGEINGLILAKAGSGAYGLDSTNGYIYTDAINGKIIAKATDGNDAYAMKALYIEINGNIGEDARIIAKAERDNAYALDAWACHTYVGDIDGKIIAHAGRDNAYGMYDVLLIDTGTINGRISATADGNNAYGLYVASDGWDGIVIDAINGEISAEATNGSNAYALYSASDINVGNIGEYAEISATAGQNNAYGLYVDDAGSHYLSTGDIYGTITATAGDSNAAGLASDGTLTTGAIYGAIRAHAGGDYAFGILSYGPMNVTIDGGEVSAIADGGTHAAAIQSGRLGVSGLEYDTTANDLVTIYAGSTIVGDINLANNGSDNDTLNLFGYNNAYSTTLDDNIVNVENINITGGTWYINGDVYNNANGTMVNGGILEGTGTLENLYVKDGGTLNPGNSIGTIKVGNLTLSPGAVYEVDVDNSENADNVKVTGTADLNDATIRGNVFGGERIDHSFDVNVLDAGTLNGAFATPVVSNTLFPIYTVSYDYTDPCVILHVDADYAYYASTDNERSVGNAFNYIVDNGLDTGDMDDVLTAIEGLPDGAAANNAYDQLMPQDALGQAEIIRNAMNQYSESVFGRMDNIRNSRQYAMMSSDSRYLLASAGNATALPPKTDEWMPFAKGFGVWGDRNAESDILGYQYNIYGLAGGVDKLVSDNMLIGLSVAGSRANIDYSQSGTSSDIDSMFCSLYGSYFVDDWHVGLTLGYGHSWYDSQRGIPFIGRSAESDHQGNSYSAAVELGKNLGDKSMILEPVAGVGYTAVQESGYTEKGAGALDLKVDSATADGIYGKLGVRVAKEFRPEQNPGMILVPNVSAFWVHDFADRVELNSSFVGGGSFTTQGLEPMRDTFNIGAGLNVYYNKNLRLFVDYGWQSASNFNSNTVQLGAQWSF